MFYRGLKFFKFLFANLFILYAILLVFHIAAHQAMFTSCAAFQKHRIRAVVAILQVCASVALNRIYTFVAEFRFSSAETVNTVLALVQAVTVIAVSVFI